MSSDDPLAAQEWTDYEKSMIEFLREERRRKRGIAPDEPAPTPLESPPRDAERAGSAPMRLASSSQDAPAQSAPTPLSGQSWQDDQLGQSAPEQLPQDRHPANPAPLLRAQPARHSGSRLRFTLLGSLLIAIVAGAATVILKPDRNSNQAAAASPEATMPDQLVQKDSNSLIARIDESADRVANGGYEVLGDRVRLRSAPAKTSSVLRTVRQGTIVRIKERPVESEWCLIQLTGGREGWMKCDFLKLLPESEPDPHASNIPHA